MEINFTEFEIYRLSLIVFGLFGIFSCIWMWTVRSENIESRERVARSRYLGLVLAFLDLLWCIPHAKPLLPVSFHEYLLPAVFVCTFLSWAFLDYLFSRAIGGFMILLAYYFLHESFTFHTFASQLFSVFCFVIGIAGIFFSGKPYLLRDMFRKLSKSMKFKISAVLFMALFSVFSIMVGILHFMPGKV